MQSKRLLIVGKTNTGKTTLLNRFTNKKEETNHENFVNIVVSYYNNFFLELIEVSSNDSYEEETKKLLFKLSNIDGTFINIYKI
jgi:GTPase SAR1 family protein